MSKTIQIGYVTGDVKQVTLNDNETLSDAMNMAGLKLANSHSLLREKGAVEVEPTERPEDGQVYYIAQNEDHGI